MHKNTQVEDFIRWIDGAQPKTGFSLLRIATNVGKGGRGLEFPPAKFVWAWCSINSRCVYCPLTSFDQERPERFTKHLEINTDTPCSDRWLEMTSHGTSDVALIPFFDFLNHNPGVTCRLVVNTPERMVQLFVDQPISAGEQVFINYGSHDNLTLLLEYGFSLSMDENPNDAVYPSSADLECVLSISDDNRLDRIVSFLDLTGMVTHGALRIWSTVCFTRTGPSLHLLLLLHLNTVIENANCLDDVLSQMDRNKLYEMDEDMLSQCLRPFLLRLLTRLQQQQDVDYQRVLNKRQHLPCHSLSASDCLQALEQFLVSRKELLQRIELVMSQVSSCLE
ncbi:unnamed protein product [Echinostoma caproni]|uniref:SET domain-containing protein n=1 Tax=Echinostoma caproni TaxID=27848 RepID=A0A183AL92_9TREM|nr:unnamed protein product [Echinostoma caproni]